MNGTVRDLSLPTALQPEMLAAAEDTSLSASADTDDIEMMAEDTAPGDAEDNTAMDVEATVTEEAEATAPAIADADADADAGSSSSAELSPIAPVTGDIAVVLPSSAASSADSADPTDSEPSDMPPKPMSGYFLFLGDPQLGRPSVSHLGMTEQTPVLSKRWNALSEEQQLQFKEAAVNRKATWELWAETAAGKIFVTKDKAEKQAKKDDKREKALKETEKSANMTAEDTWIDDKDRKKDKRTAMQAAAGDDKKLTAGQVKKVLREDWAALSNEDRQEFERSKAAEKAEWTKKVNKNPPRSRQQPATAAQPNKSAASSSATGRNDMTEADIRQKCIHYLQNLDDRPKPNKQKVMSMAIDYVTGDGGADFAREIIHGIRLAHPDLDGLATASPMSQFDDEPTASSPIEGDSNLMSFMRAENDSEPAPAPVIVRKTIKNMPAAAAKLSPTKKKGGGLHGKKKGGGLHGPKAGGLHGDNRVTVEN